MAEFGFSEGNTLNMKQAEVEMQYTYDRYGMEGLKKWYKKKTKEWKHVPLYVGITGRPGVGKSTFINAIRGVKQGDVGAAATGVIETTTTVEQYPHPKNKQLVLCDLPGVGTPSFSKDTYFTDPRIGFDKFDMFLILTSDRFYEDDRWLAEGIGERKKAYFFIRTKIAQDLNNEKQANESFYKENPDAIKGVIHDIRENCENHLVGLYSSHKGAERVYLIDSFQIDNPLFDMNELTVQLIDNFPALKRSAFILCLSGLTPNIIKAKKIVLRERIRHICALSAVGRAVPIPGVSLALDVRLVLKEIVFYREQLELDEAKLKQAAASVEMSWDTFKNKTNLQSLAISYTQDGIRRFCHDLVVSKRVELDLKYSFPILRNIVGAVLAYKSTKMILEQIIDMMAEDVQRVNECIANASVTSVKK